MPAIVAKATTWEAPMNGKSSSGGQNLFASQCVLCHGPAGFGNGEMAFKLSKAPANLVKGPFIWSLPTADLELKVRRIVKFGIPGTDMPGHETLTDEQVTALAKFVLNLRS